MVVYSGVAASLLIILTLSFFMMIETTPRISQQYIYMTGNSISPFFIPAHPAGSRHRHHAVVADGKAGHGLHLRPEAAHPDFAPEQKPRHLHAQLISSPRGSLELCPQHAPPDAARIAVGRGGTFQIFDVVPLPGQTKGRAAAQRLQFLFAIGAGAHRPQHPVTKRAAARVKHPAQLPQNAANAAVFNLHQSFLTAMMTRTFLPAVQPKLSYQPVSLYSSVFTEASLVG